MPFRAVLLLVLFAVLAVFVAANWAAFNTPTTLSLLVGTIQAPLGLVMLGIAGLLCLVFLAYAFYLQTTLLLETRRMTRELQAQRQLADQAEASRFTELRTALDARFDRLDGSARGGVSADGAALDRLRDDLRMSIDSAVNGLAAQIAELDDRIRPGGDGTTRGRLA